MCGDKLEGESNHTLLCCCGDCGGLSVAWECGRGGEEGREGEPMRGHGTFRGGGIQRSHSKENFKV